MLRLTYVLAVFFTMTPAFIASLWVLDKLKLPGRRPLSVRYYRALCGLLHVRIRVVGQPAHGKPTLILANHVSWLDIPVISAIHPVAFVAKREVAGWPIVGIAAKLLRTVFVDRTRRHQTAEVNAEIAQRLNTGDPVVLFAEGTSSDGNSVIPFKTSLFAAAKPAAATPMGTTVSAQTLALTYNKVYGLPLCRRGRHLVAWYGDMDLGPHAWRLLGLGPIDAYLRIGPPMPLDQFPDRKALARYAEDKVRSDVAELLRGGGENGAITPKKAPEPAKTPALADPSKATSPA